MPGRDPDHWLHRMTAREWLNTAMREISNAERVMGEKDRRAALAGLRRAAGMSLNAMLCVQEPLDIRYGRSFMEHLEFLQNDEQVPAEVRDAARLLVTTPLPGSEIVFLRTASRDERLVDATRTVMAHAYAMVVRTEHSDEPDAGQLN